MSTFSPTDAAFEGFRITREKPRAVAVWALVYLAVSVLLSVMTIWLAGPELMALETSGATSSADPAVAMAAFGKLMPLYGVLLPIGLIIQAVIAAAIYRVVMRPTEPAFHYLKLGRDELRLVLLTLIYFFLAIASVFIVVFVAGVVAALLAIVAGPLAAVVGVGVGLFAAGILVWLGVRLSLCAPQTFAEGRLRLFDSWHLTKGHFWSLFGAYFLSFVLALVVGMMALIIIALLATAAALATGGSLHDAGAVFRTDTTSVAAYFKPGVIVSTVLSAGMMTLYYVVIYAPAAVAYRDLTATSSRVE
ncbi:MAG: hypothetical protein JWP92_2180 [Caulobacter sp.]|nr:hypothetical protein [Caulobacter sp.]